MRFSIVVVEVQRTASPLNVIGRAWPVIVVQTSACVGDDAVTFEAIDRKTSYVSALGNPCVFPQLTYLLNATPPS